MDIKTLFLSIRSWLLPPGSPIAPGSRGAWDNAAYPLGYDISAYQGAITPPRMRDSGAVFVYVRAGLGLSPDARFYQNWEALKGVLFRGAYYAVKPNEPWRTQCSRFISLVARDPGELPPAIDVERRDGMSNSSIAQVVYSFWSEISSWWGAPAVIYSSKYYAESLMGRNLSWYPEPWWWIAHYLVANPITGYADEHPGPCALPAGVPAERLLIHQTAGKGRGGAERGVQSLNLDYNRWVNGVAHLASFANPKPNPHALSLEERVRRLEIIHGIL